MHFITSLNFILGAFLFLAIFSIPFQTNYIPSLLNRGLKVFPTMEFGGPRFQIPFVFPSLVSVTRLSSDQNKLTF